MGGLNQNADTADAGGVSDKIMTLGREGVFEQKSKENYKNNH